MAQAKKPGKLKKDENKYNIKTIQTNMCRIMKRRKKEETIESETIPTP